MKNGKVLQNILPEVVVQGVAKHSAKVAVNIGGKVGSKALNLASIAAKGFNFGISHLDGNVQGPRPPQKLIKSHGPEQESGITLTSPEGKTQHGAGVKAKTGSQGSIPYESISYINLSQDAAAGFHHYFETRLEKFLYYGNKFHHVKETFLPEKEEDSITTLVDNESNLDEGEANGSDTSSIQVRHNSDKSPKDTIIKFSYLSGRPNDTLKSVKNSHK